MFFQLTGILDDGSDFAIGVPTSGETPLKFPIGASVTLELTVLRPSGNPVQLSGGTLNLTVRRAGSAFSQPIRKTGTLSPTAGQASFTLAPADTARMDPGAYVYDIWFTDGATPANRDPVVPLSPLQLLPAATPPNP